MTSNVSVGKLLLMLGGGLIALGALWLLAEKLGFPLGRLPGDIHVTGERGSFHFPIVTCLVVSVVVSLILKLFGR